MKKSLAMAAALCAALVFASCNTTKESAYKKAYEKAKAQEQAEQTTAQQNASTDAPVVTPLVEKQADQATVVDNSDNATVRSEDVTIVSGSGLQDFSVVVGSFSLKANAEGLQGRLKAAGYNAQIAYNSSRNLYRVVASTFANKSDAVQSRNTLRANYPDAWLLYKNK